MRPVMLIRRALRYGPLSEREFRLLFTGQALSVIGDGIAPIAIAFAVLDLTHSATDLGLVLTAGYAPMVAFLLIGGVWADRLSRRGVMLVADAARAGTQATIGVRGHMYDARPAAADLRGLTPRRRRPPRTDAGCLH